MGNFDNTLARMKALYTYGKGLDESKKIDAHTLEYKATAADGKTYGIIKECNKYYIKVASAGKEAIAESYEYLGGFCNKKNYEYSSYNNALKNFELKMASINESCDGNVNISSLDPFKKGEFIVEGTSKMKDEIARQRQIMHNVSMIMNESSSIGASRKDDVVMYDGKNPEAETGKKGDEGMTSATAKPEYAGSKTNGVDKKVGPFDNEPTKCEDQLKESCDCGEENCSCDWGSEGIGKGKDPKSVGWEMDGQQVVNEEENDWASEGLPSTPGVGEADTDHNNDPFNNTVNESEEMDDMDSDVEGEDVADFDTEEDFDVEGMDNMEDDEDMDFPEIDDYEDLDVETDDIEIGDEEDVEFDDEEDIESDEDILRKIEELQAQIDALRAQVNVDPETEDDILVDSDEVSEFEDDFNSEDDSEFEESMDGMEEPVDSDDFDEEIDECGDMPLMEAKKNYMNHIVESVVNKMINEDELHVFGKHPGYQKKPMNLPATGEDKNKWGEDWNDESVYDEQPFGTKIGDSAPFNKIVDAITKDVLTQLSGDAFKKKVK